MIKLPKLMVAPNGARKTTDDHSALPVTIEQTVMCAKACFEAGADGIHAHIRDGEQRHLLDAGVYKELISELSHHVPEIKVQITTEAVGIYSPAEQRQLIFDVVPKSVSIGLLEIISDNDTAANTSLFAFAKEVAMNVQMIIYDPKELEPLSQLIKSGVILADQIALLFVLGRYTQNQQSDASDIIGFVKKASELGLNMEWCVCAFGREETQCLVTAHSLGGKMRVGFENNFENPDGSIAKSNQERVEVLKLEIENAGMQV